MVRVGWRGSVHGRPHGGRLGAALHARLARLASPNHSLPRARLRGTPETERYSANPSLSGEADQRPARHTQSLDGLTSKPPPATGTASRPKTLARSRMTSTGLLSLHGEYSPGRTAFLTIVFRTRRPALSLTRMTRRLIGLSFNTLAHDLKRIHSHDLAFFGGTTTPSNIGYRRLGSRTPKK